MRRGQELSQVLARHVARRLQPAHELTPPDEPRAGRRVNEPIWKPSAERIVRSKMAEFLRFASTRGIRCELSTAAHFWLAQGGQEQTSLLSPQLNYGGRNYEKDAIDHCLGSSGVVCMGAEPTAAAYEDARRAEAAVTNHDHHRHRY